MTAKRWIASALALAVLAAASFGVSAAITSRRAPVSVPPSEYRCNTALMSLLDLTPEQQKRIAPICEDYCRQQLAGRGELQAARARLMDALRQPRPSWEDIDTALEDVGRVQARIQRGAAEFLLNIKPVLSEAQQAKLFDTVGQRFCQQGTCGSMGRFGGGQGRGGGPGWMRHLK